MLSKLPVKRLSIPITWNPSLMNRSHKWDPKKPAAPVIKILGTIKLLNEKMFELNYTVASAYGSMVEMFITMNYQLRGCMGFSFALLLLYGDITNMFSIYKTRPEISINFLESHHFLRGIISK